MTLADNVETLGVDLSTRGQEVGSKSKSEKKEVQNEILAHQEEQSLPEDLREGGCQEVVTSRHGANNDLGSSCSGNSSHGNVKIEETDGSSSEQKEHDLPVLVHGSMWP